MQPDVKQKIKINLTGNLQDQIQRSIESPILDPQSIKLAPGEVIVEVLDVHCDKCAHGKA